MCKYSDNRINAGQTRYLWFLDETLPWVFKRVEYEGGDYYLMEWVQGTSGQKADAACCKDIFMRYSAERTRITYKLLREIDPSELPTEPSDLYDTEFYATDIYAHSEPYLDSQTLLDCKQKCYHTSNCIKFGYNANLNLCQVFTANSGLASTSGGIIINFKLERKGYCSGTSLTVKTYGADTNPGTDKKSRKEACYLSCRHSGAPHTNNDGTFNSNFWDSHTGADVTHYASKNDGTCYCFVASTTRMTSMFLAADGYDVTKMPEIMDASKLTLITTYCDDDGVLTYNSGDNPGTDTTSRRQACYEACMGMAGPLDTSQNGFWSRFTPSEVTRIHGEFRWRMLLSQERSVQMYECSAIFLLPRTP